MSTIEALHAFGRALQGLGIDTGKVEVSLPPVEWQTLSQALSDEPADTFGRTPPRTRPNSIEVLGVKYLVRFEAR